MRRPLTGEGYAATVNRRAQPQYPAGVGPGEGTLALSRTLLSMIDVFTCARRQRHASQPIRCRRTAHRNRYAVFVRALSGIRGLSTAHGMPYTNCDTPHAM
eukprot:152456-Rhodomonas_salina.4